MLTIMSLIGQRARLWAQSVKMHFTKKDKLYILGYNANSLNIYRSDTKCSKVIAGNVPESDCDALYSSKIYYISTRSFKSILKQIFKSVAKKSTNHTVIINTEGDDTNIALCNAFIDRIKTQCGEQPDLYNRLRVCVFGDTQYADIYSDVVDRSAGCIHFVDKYQKVAMSFIDRYPFTRFMDERHVDYSTACVKKDVDINVCMIGFGKTNQQVFLTSVANNQFVTVGDKGVQLKPVCYHIFDSVTSENDKYLNSSYYRFRNECRDVNPTDYLPLPELPASEKYYHLDVNDTRFYSTIRSIAQKSAGNVNFAIIAYGSDVENIDLARKLATKRREWGIDNLVIFVRVSDYRKDEYLLDEVNCFVFGDEKNDVYNIDKILHDKISCMAYMRNELYALESQIASGCAVNDQLIAANREQANRDWFQNKTQFERESNLYGCLSLRSKLNMIGFDYCEMDANDLPAVSEEEYLKRYAANDLPTYEANSLGKQVVSYNLNFPDSLRKNLAIHEHYRWNSFMISKGMIPSTIDQILHETTIVNGKINYTNGKNYAMRRHGNLTTFDGLVEFRKLVARRDHATEMEKDVIKYDYQLMDDAYWLLTLNGYKIVER